MKESKLIECIPNFSEGRDPDKIGAIVDAIREVKGIKVLNVDPGKAANRTVVTFVGDPDCVVQAAFNGIRRASELIDMRQQEGTHPRIGGTDVCPLVPLSNISLAETAHYARILGKRVGQELGIPVFMYEAAATQSYRQNLATIRRGEYEGLSEKLKQAKWQPDYGPASFVPNFGATVIGARNFLIAYNVNLNTSSVEIAQSIAEEVREIGRVKKENGAIVRDENGKAIRIPGRCKFLKAIGWYIEEYGFAQVSMNLTNIEVTSIHDAYKACEESAAKKGVKVTGSELIGMIPKKALLAAGTYFTESSLGIEGLLNDEQQLSLAVTALGLSQLAPFHWKERVLEYQLGT